MLTHLYVTFNLIKAGGSYGLGNHKVYAMVGKLHIQYMFFFKTKIV